MTITPTTNLSVSEPNRFTAWAVETCKKHGETLTSMLKSADPLDRVIAKQILKEAGEKP